MNEMTPVAGIGHNNPPEPTVAERVKQLVDNANRWLSERPEITDDDMAQKCSAFIDQITAELKAVETERMAAKRPHLDAEKAIDSQYNPIKALLETAKKLLEPKRSAWLKLLQARKDAQAAEAQKRAQEAAAQAAEAQKRAQEAAGAGGDIVGATVAAEAAQKAADDAAKDAKRTDTAPVNLKSNYGGRTASLRTTWHARVTDHAKATRHYMKHPKVVALIEDLAGADARAFGKERGTDSRIPGVEFYSEQN